MALAEIRYFSRSLGKASSFYVVLPEDPETPRPWSVFYLLHGYSDDHSIWQRRTSVERYVQESGVPLALVMPDGGHGWYTNAKDGYQYESDLMTDVMGLVERTFPVKQERTARAIGGLSMGGYGAVKLGLKHHDKFASLTSHSGAVGLLRDNETADRFGPAFNRVFGESPKDGPEDPFALVQSIDHGKLPALRFDCGRDDFLLKQNQSFHEHLESLRITHEYEEFDGGHDWSYWDLHIREAIAFHVRNLRLERPK
jgi:S-formylglutathione hydrolase FrmB